MSDNRITIGDLGFALFCTFIGVCLGAMVGVQLSGQEYDKLLIEAVKRGHAEWVVSPEGHTKFQWKPKDTP